MTKPRVNPELCGRLKAAVGAAGWIEDEAAKAPYLTDELGRYHGRTPLVLRPDTTAQVAAVVRICAGARVGIVPQGGNTGYVGAATPDPSGDQIVMALGRLNRIRAVDPINYTLTVEAGCVLADVQRTAAAADRLFPLSLAAEGSCQIGGNLATNAGGTAVLRYGSARDLVLGLEVVLPDGEIWNGLRQLRKDNSGYDLTRLFVGAEGTLGIITAAVLKLFPHPRHRETGLVAIADPGAAIALLARLRARSADALSAFEYIHRRCLDQVLSHIDGLTDPFDQAYEHYLLLEWSGTPPAAIPEAALAGVLEEALDQGQVLDAVLAASVGQAQRLWQLREAIPEAQRRAGACIKHDVAVPISAVPLFLTQATAFVEARIPGVTVVPFGHLGDGNIHFNLSQPAHADAQGFLARAEEISQGVHELAVGLGGTFSAEHGIGVAKRVELQRYKSPVELELMHRLKRAFDPHGIMNPGKLL